MCVQLSEVAILCSLARQRTTDDSRKAARDVAQKMFNTELVQPGAQGGQDDEDLGLAELFGPQ